jgi:hypothetical protein
MRWFIRCIGALCVHIYMSDPTRVTIDTVSHFVFILLPLIIHVRSRVRLATKVQITSRRAPLGLKFGTPVDFGRVYRQECRVYHLFLANTLANATERRQRTQAGECCITY